MPHRRKGEKFRPLPASCPGMLSPRWPRSLGKVAGRKLLFGRAAEREDQIKRIARAYSAISSISRSVTVPPTIVRVVSTAGASSSRTVTVASAWTPAGASSKFSCTILSRNRLQVGRLFRAETRSQRR